MFLPLHLSALASLALAAITPIQPIDSRLLTAEELAADPVKSVAVVAFHVDNACGGTPQYLRMQNNTCFGPVNTQSIGRKITFKLVVVHPDCQVLAFADYPCQYGANHPAQSLKPEETCYDPSSAPKQPLSLAVLCNIKLASSDNAKQSLPPSALPSPQGTVAPQGQGSSPLDYSLGAQQAPNGGATSMSSTPVPASNSPSSSSSNSGPSTNSDGTPALSPSGNGWGSVPPPPNASASSAAPANPESPIQRPSGSQTLNSLSESAEAATSPLVVNEIQSVPESVLPARSFPQNPPVNPNGLTAPPPDMAGLPPLPPDAPVDPSNLHPNDGWGVPGAPAIPSRFRRRQTAPPPSDAASPPKEAPVDPSNLHLNDGWGPVPKGITPLPPGTAAGARAH